jgi:hypothetical protein
VLKRQGRLKHSDIAGPQHLRLEMVSLFFVYASERVMVQCFHTLTRFEETRRACLAPYSIHRFHPLKRLELSCRAWRMGSQAVSWCQRAQKDRYCSASLLWLRERTYAQSALAVEWQILTTVLARSFYLRLSTGLFRNTSAIQSFLEYYSKFDFLEPKHIGKYGSPVHESQKYNPRGLE